MIKLLNGSEKPCKQLVNGKDIIAFNKPVQFYYHIHIDCPGILEYARVNGGILADVWCDCNTNLQRISNGEFTIR